MDEEENFECTNCGEEFVISHRGKSRIEVCPFCAEILYDDDDEINAGFDEWSDD